MKKFTEELTALNTPDIRSVLRYLNNNVEKKVKPTALASMKHDRAMAIIEDKYKPADIEKALAALKSGEKPTRKAPEAPKKHDTPKTEAVKKSDGSRSFSDVMVELHEIGDKLDELVTELKTDHGSLTPKPASYILDMTEARVKELKPGFFIIGASDNGAGVLDGPHPTLEAAHKAWPEAIHRGPITTEDELGDIL